MPNCTCMSKLFCTCMVCVFIILLLTKLCNYLWASRSSFGVYCAKESRMKICPHLKYSNLISAYALPFILGHLYLDLFKNIMTIETSGCLWLPILHKMSVGKGFQVGGSWKEICFWIPCFIRNLKIKTWWCETRWNFCQ